MTRKQEDKIIEQAQDILERRIAVKKDIKINLQKVMYYDAYFLGVLQGGTQMRYRNHKRNKKCKLESVECYFVKYRNAITEVK